MFPGGFIDGGKETENFALVTEVVEEVGKRAEDEDGDNAYDGENCLVHGFIIACSSLGFSMDV